MPNTGDVVKGAAIGKSGRNLFVWSSCPACGCGHWVRRQWALKGKIDCHRCSNKATGLKLRGQRHKGFPHRRIASNGYVLLKLAYDDPLFNMANKEGYVLEHRLVVAKELKRALLKGEVVHHRNGCRDDNRIENLELTPSIKEHSSLTIQCMSCSLRKEIRLLQWQIRELNNALQAKLKLEV